ncbi:MAG: hypothetical protein ACRD5G_06405 [Candidatus Acidiferrales bacterium]
MATIAVSKSGLQPATGAYDRVFYSGMAIAMALTVFAGFAPTYYLRSAFGAPPTLAGLVSLTPLAHIHGALFTGWVLLFIVQTALVARRSVAVHRRLGIAGIVLAAAMLAVGTLTAIRAAARGSAPPGADPLEFLVIPLGDMALFATFVAGAFWLRRNKEAHKRLMLLAYISIVVAAVARLPGVIPLGPYGFFGFTTIFLIIAIIYDAMSRRRVHPVYIWGGLLFVLSVPLRLMLSGTPAWRAFADWLV